MICYRLIRAKHCSENRDFLKTEFSAREGGRWNERKRGVLYSSTDIETAVSECGCYWILSEAEGVNRSHNGARPPAWQDRVVKFKEIDAVIAKLEIDDELKLLDLRNPLAANDAFERANLNLTYPEYLKHAYLTIPGNATRKLSAWIEDQGYEGFQVSSARNPSGYCIIIFDSFVSMGAIKVLKKDSIKLFGLKNNGSRIDTKFAAYSETSFEYEINGSKPNLCAPSKIK